MELCSSTLERGVNREEEMKAGMRVNPNEVVFGGKMMSQLGPLRRHGKCLTEMNVVYKIADSSSFLPDIPSHL